MSVQPHADPQGNFQSGFKNDPYADLHTPLDDGVMGQRETASSPSFSDADSSQRDEPPVTDEISVDPEACRPNAETGDGRSAVDPGDDNGADGAETPIRLTIDRVLQALTQGKMEERGLLPYSSNYNFLVLVNDGKLQLPAVYKPRRGENPLWDFPNGTLCLRETAAYVVSAALEWHLVPPTVLREGTRGIGSVQFYVDCDPDVHYFSVREDARFALALRQITLFDFIVNNADRKSGHCLIGSDQRLWAIDHGICFHTDYKLRTVIWEFGGEPIDPPLLDDLARLQRTLAQKNSRLSRQLAQLLSSREYAALLARLNELLTSQTYPAPVPYHRNYPWPPI